jgi:O-antigen ligase
MPFSKKIIPFFMIILPLIAVVAPRALAFVPIILGLITLIEYTLHYKELPKINRPLSVFIAVFFIFAGASYFWSVAPDETLNHITKSAVLIIPSLFFLFIIRSKKFPHICNLKHIPPIFSLAVILVLLEIFFNHPIYRLTHDLADQTIIAPSVMNRCLVSLSLLLWPALYILHNKKQAPFIILLLIAMCFAVFFAQSQSAIVALVLGSLSFLIALKFAKPFLYILCASVILGILASPWIAQWLFNLRPEILIGWQNANAAQRIELWDFVARYALQQPWYGWGIEATRYIHDFDSAQIFYTTTQITHPHNFALQLWMELGLPGALFGSGFVFLSIKYLLTFDQKDLPFMIAAVTSMLIINLVGYDMWQSWLIGLEFTVISLFMILTKKKSKDI